MHFSCVILERYDDALAECRQRGLYLLGFGVVPRIQHPAHNGFTHTEPLGKLSVRHAAFAHGEIQRQLRRKVERNADEALPALGLRRRGNLVTTGASGRNVAGYVAVNIRDPLYECQACCAANELLRRDRLVP